MRASFTFSVIALSLGLIGCAQKDNNRPPEAATAASQSRAAEEFPDQLEEQSSDFDDSAAQIDEQTQSMEGMADELSDPNDWKKTEEVVQAADAAGKSDRYAQAARERDAVNDFFDSDGGKKVAGNVAYAADQQCKGAGGQAAGALRSSLDKQLKEKMADANEAHALIDRYEDDLGKQNTAKLREQADDIAEASYVANIELPTRKYELERSIAAGSQAKSTLDREIDDAKKVADDPDASDAKKKKASERLSRLEEARTKLDEQLEAAKEKQKKLEKQVKDAQEKYRKALDALLKKIRDKAKDAPKDDAKA